MHRIISSIKEKINWNMQKCSSENYFKGVWIHQFENQCHKGFTACILPYNSSL